MKDNYFGFDLIQRRTLERLLEMIPTVPEGGSIILPGFLPLWNYDGNSAIGPLALTVGDGSIVEKVRLGVATMGLVSDGQSFALPVAGTVTAIVEDNDVDITLLSTQGVVNDGQIIAATGGFVTFTVVDNVVTCEFTAV